MLNLFIIGSVDAANNLRDNLTSYHDIIISERWEMRFFGFFLGICEANAFAAFRNFSRLDRTMGHASFKDSLAFQMLKYCESLTSLSQVGNEVNNRTLRRDTKHSYVSMSAGNGTKRIRLACSKCKKAGVPGTRVEKSCSCNPDHPLCQTCYNSHLKEVWNTQTHLNNSL